MKIYLVRHGETTGDVEDRYGGDYDDHLSKNGIEESEGLAKKLNGKGIQIFYCSPRTRAIETEAIVNRNLKVELKIVEDLRERNNYGVMTGLTKADGLREYPDEVMKLKKDSIRHHVKGSEDYDSFKKRVVDAFEKVTKEKKHSTIAIVTHGGPIRCILREVLRSGELETLNNCSIFIIDKLNGRLSLVSMEGASLVRL